MSHGVYEYLEWVGDQLIADATIAAYCSETFGKTLSVSVGQDETQMPSDEDCPMVVLIAGGRGHDGANHIKTRSAKILICIKDSLDNIKAANESGTIVFPGLAKLDEFADMVTDALDGLIAHPSGYYVSDIVDGPDDQINFPVYKAWIGLTIQLDSDF